MVSKRFYGAFDGTDLEDTLFDFEVEDVVLAGQHYALLRSATPLMGPSWPATISWYRQMLSVPMEGVDQEAALGNLKDSYGVTLTTSTALIGRPVLRTASFNPRM